MAILACITGIYPIYRSKQVKRLEDSSSLHLKLSNLQNSYTISTTSTTRTAAHDTNNNNNSDNSNNNLESKAIRVSRLLSLSEEWNNIELDIKIGESKPGAFKGWLHYIKSSKENFGIFASYLVRFVKFEFKTGPSLQTDQFKMTCEKKRAHL